MELTSRTPAPPPGSSPSRARGHGGESPRMPALAARGHRTAPTLGERPEARRGPGMPPLRNVGPSRADEGGGGTPHPGGYQTNRRVSRVRTGGNFKGGPCPSRKAGGERPEPFRGRSSREARNVLPRARRVNRKRIPRRVNFPPLTQPGGASRTARGWGRSRASRPGNRPCRPCRSGARCAGRIPGAEFAPCLPRFREASGHHGKRPCGRLAGLGLRLGCPRPPPRVTLFPVLIPADAKPFRKNAQSLKRLEIAAQGCAAFLLPFRLFVCHLFANASWQTTEGPRRRTPRPDGKALRCLPAAPSI